MEWLSAVELVLVLLVVEWVLVLLVVEWVQRFPVLLLWAVALKVQGKVLAVLLSVWVPGLIHLPQEL